MMARTPDRLSPSTTWSGGAVGVEPGRNQCHGASYRECQSLETAGLFAARGRSLA